MSTDKNANLIEVKRQLAEKYEHLATITKSEPRRKTYVRRARRYRDQAADIARLAKA